MLRTIISLVVSAVLLVFSYPQVECGPLAWFAFVPLLFLIDKKSNKASFWTFFFLGLLFFGATLGWFVYVTYPGAILLIAYLSLYFALFALAYRYFKPLPLLLRVFCVPAAWVVLEYIRAHLFTGFGWVMLGHSQYKNTLLIQIADLTGVYGVSYLVMLVNILIVETIKAKDMIALRRAQITVIVILSLSLGYGAWEAARTPQWPTVKVGVVQPNIPQAIKWDPNLQGWIVSETIRLSERFKGLNPDIIIWPETSLPGVIGEAPELMDTIKAAAHRLATPMLIGAITQEEGRYYNSAYLVSAKGQVVGRYDKVHLVPFGEYLPLRPLLGWINNFVPLEDFTSGGKYTILEAGCKAKSFGTLICFEDTVSYVRRRQAQEGASFFVNMTNDAWFMDTKAPFIHLQAAVFGCVENKRALVRAANTGFSGFVDPFGRIIAAAHDDNGKRTFVSATAFAQIPAVTTKTFYTKYGDVFTVLCLFAILWGVFNRRRYA